MLSTNPLRSSLGWLWFGIAALVAASAAGRAQVLVENVSAAQQLRWIYCGVPPGSEPAVDGVASDGGTTAFRIVPARRGLRLLVDLAPHSKLKLQLSKAAADGDAGKPFVWHQDIGKDPLALLPTFACGDAASEPPAFWAPGAPRPAQVAYVRLEDADAAHQIWHVHTRILARDLTIDEWSTVYSGLPTVEWVVHATLGTVAGGAGVSGTLPALLRRCRAACTVDFAARTGTPPNTVDVEGTWTQQLTPDGLPWGRASTVEQRGATLAAVDDARLVPGALPAALWTQWDGAWLAGGAVPVQWPGASQELAARLSTYLHQAPVAGGLYALRDWCQPKESGTTGEQIGFGFAPSVAVTMQAPFEIREALWHAQSYGLRPYANREANGDPVRAAAHPRANIYNRRPDERFTFDMLGWPKPIPYSWPGPGYSTSDGQHRDDLFLAATIALTDDPGARAVADDIVELEQMELPPPTAPGPIGAPRDWGRTLMAEAAWIWLGYGQLAPRVQQKVDWLFANAAYHTLPEDSTHTVRLLNDRDPDGAKYGWLNADGSRVEGWQGWQHAIAMGGLLQCSRVLPLPRARELALVLAETIVRHVIVETPTPDVWIHSYAQRARAGDDRGVPFPLVNYYVPQPNYDVWIDGACYRWSMAAAHLLQLEASGDLARRAAAQVTAYGPARSRMDAQWWAIR